MVYESSDIVRLALQEDAPWGDVTTMATVRSDAIATAAFVARQPGVLSGSDVVGEVFRQIDPNADLVFETKDAAVFGAGDTIARVSGNARNLLRAERVALNFLQRLCGVSTLTAAYVSTVAGTSVRIVDTRKTTPGMRLLEKAAVRHGGGYNHRYCLSDAVLVKDNHLAAIGGIENLGVVRESLPHLMKVEVEVDSIDQMELALAAGADSILCDNFTIEQLALAVARVNKRALVNASGGITLSNARDVAFTGVDLISVGALTHSVVAIDIGLDFSSRST